MSLVPRGSKILRQYTQEVDPEDPGLPDLFTKMLIVMLSKRGVGIAAPQIGRSERCCIIGDTARLYMVNPNIVWYSPTKITDYEGCLSCPGERHKVERSQAVRVEFYDLKDRTQKTITASYLPARIIQHEVDHLDGILIDVRGKY